jgi:DNA-binding transcriptional LysR family regulator
MDVRFLESLIAVVEQGSISAAAKAQGLTATAISQRIKALEASFGAQLLVRAGHCAQPTRACLQLMPEARALVANAAQLQRSFAPLSGPLRIGAIETAVRPYPRCGGPHHTRGPRV